MLKAKLDKYYKKGDTVDDSTEEGLKLLDEDVEKITTLLIQRRRKTDDDRKRVRNYILKKFGKKYDKNLDEEEKDAEGILLIIKSYIFQTISKTISILLHNY